MSTNPQYQEYDCNKSRFVDYIVNIGYIHIIIIITIKLKEY